MNPSSPSTSGPRRPQAREYLRAAVALSVALLTVGVIAARGRTEPSAFAATNAGPAAIVNPPGAPGAGLPLAGGTVNTPFVLAPPVGAACTGDSASDNYRVHSFMVPASVDPNTITYDADGPFPQALGASLRAPLFSATFSPVVNVLTAVKTPTSPGGLLTGLPVLSFAALDGADVPAGNYLIGYACVQAPAGLPAVLDRWWSAQLTIGAGISWTSGVITPPTTTTLAPTTTVAASTTTVAASTTTVAASTTTVAASTTTSTSTTVPRSTTTTVPRSTTTTVPRSTTTMPATSTTIPGATTTTVDDDDDHGKDRDDDHDKVDDTRDRDHGGKGDKPRECGRRRYGRGGTDRVGTTCVPRTTPVTPVLPRHSKERA